jgi:hypothetical protein
MLQCSLCAIAFSRLLFNKLRDISTVTSGVLVIETVSPLAGFEQSIPEENKREK